jgi:hypothetical protein
VRTALYGKALPLALAATILTVLFLPDAKTIVRGAYSLFMTLGWGAFDSAPGVPGNCGQQAATIVGFDGFGSRPGVRGPLR